MRGRKCLTCSCARTRKSGSGESRPGGLVKAGRLRGLAAGPLADGPQRVILRRQRARCWLTKRDDPTITDCSDARELVGGVALSDAGEGVGRSGLFWHRRVRARRRRLRLAVLCAYTLVDSLANLPRRSADFQPGDEIDSLLSEDPDMSPGPIQIFRQRRADVDRPPPKSTHRRRGSARGFAIVKAPSVRAPFVLFPRY